MRYRPLKVIWGCMAHPRHDKGCSRFYLSGVYACSAYLPFLDIFVRSVVYPLSLVLRHDTYLSFTCSGVNCAPMRVVGFWLRVWMHQASRAVMAAHTSELGVRHRVTRFAVLSGSL